MRVHYLLLAFLGIMNGVASNRPVERLSSPGVISLPLTTARGPFSEAPSSSTSNDTSSKSLVDSLTGCPSLDFTVPVTIGGQTFQLIVDTGSTTLAVAGSSCTSCSSAGVTPVYTPGSTAQVSSTTVKSTYGDGSGWSGVAVRDQVSIGSSQSVATSIAVMQSQNDFFHSGDSCSATAHSGSASQGIIGFAYGSLAIAGTDAWFEDMVSVNQLPNIFALQTCLTDGKMWLGGYDQSAMTGSLQCTPIVDKEWYVVNVQTIGIGNAATTTLDTSNFGQSIIDSGTTQISLIDPAFTNVVNAIMSNSAFKSEFPSMDYTSASARCYKSTKSVSQLNSELPPMTVVFQGAQVTLNAVGSYIVPMTANAGYYCPGIGSGQDTSIFGWSFSSQLTVVYDKQNSQVGFAAQQGCTSDGSAPYTGATISLAPYNGSSGPSCTGFFCSGASTNHMIPQVTAALVAFAVAAIHNLL